MLPNPVKGGRPMLCSYDDGFAKGFVIVVKERGNGRDRDATTTRRSQRRGEHLAGERGGGRAARPGADQHHGHRDLRA